MTTDEQIKALAKAVHTLSDAVYNAKRNNGSPVCELTQEAADLAADVLESFRCVSTMTVGSVTTRRCLLLQGHDDDHLWGAA